MATKDVAQSTKDALAASWGIDHPDWGVTLHVDESYRSEEGKPMLLVADDGGVAVHNGAWMVRKSIRRITLRLTAFAKGRTEARLVVDSAVDEILNNRPVAISRVDDISDPLLTRDPDTGNFLASVLMPVLVRPA